MTTQITTLDPAAPGMCDPATSTGDTLTAAPQTVPPAPHTPWAPGPFGPNPKSAWERREEFWTKQVVPLTITQLNADARRASLVLFRPITDSDPRTGPNAAYILRDPALAGKPHPSGLELISMADALRARARAVSQMAEYEKAVELAQRPTSQPDANGSIRDTLRRATAALATVAESITRQTCNDDNSRNGSPSIEFLEKFDKATSTLKRLTDIAARLDPTLRARPRRKRKSAGRPARYVTKARSKSALNDTQNDT